MSAVAVVSEVWEPRKEEAVAAAETDMAEAEAEAEADTAATVGGCERDCERIRLGTFGFLSDVFAWETREQAKLLGSRRSMKTVRSPPISGSDTCWCIASVQCHVSSKALHEEKENFLKTG